MSITKIPNRVYRNLSKRAEFQPRTGTEEISGMHGAYSRAGDYIPCRCNTFWPNAVITDDLATSHVGHDLFSGTLMTLNDVDERRKETDHAQL